MSKREYYRHVSSGELGYKIAEDRIRFDRPESGDKERDKALAMKFKSQDWVPVEEHRPLAPAHLAEICFNADAALCFYLGLRENSSKQWVDLTADQKRKWMTDGPTKNEWRERLWKATREALGGLIQ